MSTGVLYLLEKHGCSRISECGRNYVCTCPFHKDSNPSFEIHRDSGLFVCFSCGASGTYKTFLSRLGETSTCIEPSIDDDVVVDLPDYDSRRSLPLPRYDAQCFGNTPQYLLGRGFRPEVLQEWGIVFDKSCARVAFPVRDESGNLVGLTKRAVDPRQTPKYLHTKFKRGNYLYGMHRRRTERLIVCEGHLDAVAMSQMWGGMCVATMGCHVSDTQIALMRGYGSILLAGDADDAGRIWAASIGDRLIPYYDPCDFSIMCDYRGCKDPAEVLEKKEIIVDSVSYIDWSLQKEREK